MPEREAVLLVRLDGVGDAALCIPSLEGLRRAFPGGWFGAVCSRANAALFSHRVEHVVLYDSTQPLAVLREELEAPRYTRALIATEEVVGYRIARLSGAPLRAGFWHRLHKPFKSLWQRAQVTRAVYRPAAWTKSPEHEVRTLYRLALALGAREPVPADRESLRAWLRIEPSPSASVAREAIGFQITPKLVTGGLGPSTIAGWIVAVLNSFPAKQGVLIASAADEALAAAIFERASAAAAVPQRLRMAAALTVPQWLGVLDAVDVLVTPDTGAAHVAGMLGQRVVDIFDEPDYERVSAQWHPWAGSWRCHAKRSPDMKWDTDAYGRFLASQVRSLMEPAETAPRLSEPLSNS